MNTTLIPLTLLALFLPASARDHQENREAPPPPRPLFRALDTNDDRKLSEEEIAAAPNALEGLDQDGDGNIDLREVLPPPPSDAPERDNKHRPPPIFIVIDSDRDGSISGDELDGAGEAISKLDRNNDGEIDGREAAPHPPRHEPDGQGESHHPPGESRGRPPHGHPPGEAGR